MEKKKVLAIKTTTKGNYMLQMWKKGHYSNECDEEQTGEDKTVKHQTKKEQTSS